MKPPRAERVRIAGPAGDIEALVEIPAEDGAGISTRFGVVCHPHPLYGGTLDNKVVYTLARAFVELGVPGIRFNFRGVGGSAGRYDEGIGETEDALAVIAYGRGALAGRLAVAGWILVRRRRRGARGREGRAGNTRDRGAGNHPRADDGR